jgi:hypothetical protein
MIEAKYILIDGKPHYYTEVKLYHGRRQMNLSIAKENLKLFHSIIEESKLTYGLFNGTLLGAIRENDLIRFDEDTDVYLLDEDKDKFFRLLDVFNQHGFNVVRWEDDGLLSLMRKEEYIDIYFFRKRKKFGVFNLRVLNNEFEYPAENLENPERREFLGLSFPVPGKPEEIVEQIYGKDWKIPRIHKHSEPNTFYNTLSRLAGRLKIIPFRNKLELWIKYILKKLGL